MTTKAELITWLKTSTARRVVLVEIEGVLNSSGTAVGTLYYSNRPFAASTGIYESCIIGGVSFSEQLDLDGRATLGYGDIELDNTDGIRDALLTYIWANKTVNVYIGDASWARTDFYPIFSGYVSDIESRDRTRINLVLVDKLQQLNVAVSTATVGGTGPTRDQLVPLCFGECFNVTPILVNSANLVYQVHNGPIERVIEVRDNGLRVNATTDLTNGRFTLTANPVGTITASVQGGRYGSPISYSSTVASVIQNLLVSYGKTVPVTDINTTNFSANNTQNIGVYLTDRENVLDLCQRLANSCGLSLVVGQESDGTFKFKLVKILVDQTSGEAYSVTASDIEEHSLTISQKVPVTGAVKLGYCKNWTVQTSGLAGSTKPEVAAIFAKEYYYTTSSDATVLTRYGQTSEVPSRDTLLLTTAQASAEALRLKNIYSVPRYVYTATYYAHMLLCQLGDLVLLTHPRFGLGAGKRGTAVQINRNWLNGRVTIGLLV